jgi:hypothetical protein
MSDSSDTSSLPASPRSRLFFLSILLVCPLGLLDCNTRFTGTNCSWISRQPRAGSEPSTAKHRNASYAYLGDARRTNRRPRAPEELTNRRGGAGPQPFSFPSGAQAFFTACWLPMVPRAAQPARIAFHCPDAHFCRSKLSPSFGSRSRKPP